MRKYIIGLLLLALIAVIAFTHIGRFIFWNFADINDYKRFPQSPIEKGDNTFYFQHAPPMLEIQPPGSFALSSEYENFESFLEDKETTAFMVIKDDTILYEQYFYDHDRTSICPSFSVAKSAVSMLIGIAIDEGKIKSVHQPVTDYLDGFKYEGYDQITIEHLLNMRSGIFYRESYFNPFHEMPKFYYGKNLKKYTYKLKIKEPPDLNYDYISVNTEILAFILEEATGMSMPEYCQEKLWKQLGMEFDASWNLDSKKHKTVKAFCCLNGRPVDFAKLGRLYVKNGNWEGNQIVSEAWVNRSTTIMNDSRDSQDYPYTYHWRTLENGSFFAKGILGQYIYVYPEKGLIMVRFGKTAADIDWIKVFEMIGESID